MNDYQEVTTMYWDERTRSGRRIPIRTANNGRYVSPMTPVQPTPIQPDPVESVVAPTASVDKVERTTVEQTDWQTMALRLRAEMENFQRRQVRRANESIDAERERLLQQFLPVADNLNRALTHRNQDEMTLKQGVELVYRQLMGVLKEEGVKPIQAQGQLFDPTLHEAIATAQDTLNAGKVVEEVERGYKLGDKLLRPARVVVAA
jgi:molecular chaperone GrpE